MSRSLKLEQVCHKITDGSHNPPKGVEFSEYLMLSSKNILDGEITFEKPRFLKSEDFFSENKRTNIENGDVLLTIVGTIGRCAVVDEIKQAFTLQRSVAVLKPNKELILPKFLMFTLQNMTAQFDAGARGVAQKGIYLKSLKQFEIIVPSLAEQQRIVAKLDAAFAEIDKIATITEKKLGEAQKVYASGITEIYFSDKSAPVVPLSTISKIKGGKRLPKGKKLQIEPTSYPYIRVSDFTDFGTIDEKSIQYITEEVHSEISRYTISSDDVYVSIAGTIGKTGIISQSLDGANLTENAAKIVLNEECNKNYFYFFTTSSSFEKQAIAQTRTAAQPKLALERLGAVELPLHNKLAQQAIAGKARSLRDKVRFVKTLLNEKLLKIQALKSAILSKELQSEAA